MPAPKQGFDTPPRDIAPNELDRTLSSPAFLMPEPVLRHGKRIPPHILDCMRPAWATRVFAARPVRVAVLEDVVVGREGLVLDRNMVPLHPTLHGHQSWEPGLVRAGALVGPVPRIRGDVVLCRMPGTGNYGHWMCEMLPRAIVARSAGWGAAPLMVQAVAGPMQRVMRQSLAMLGNPRVIACGPAPVRVDRLVLVDGLSEHGSYLSPLVAAALQDITAGIAPAGPERLLLSRPPGVSRRLQDQDAIEAKAVSAGFTVLDPSKLDVCHQVAAFKAARHVVGAMGAALTNTMFCPRGTAVTALAPAMMPDTFFWFIAGLRGLRLLEVRCHAAPPLLGPALWDGVLQVDAADQDWIFQPRTDPAPPPAEAALRLIAAVFDPDYYLSRNPDVAAAAHDPLTHFLHHGRSEGRAPSALFEAAPGALDKWLSR